MKRARFEMSNANEILVTAKLLDDKLLDDTEMTSQITEIINDITANLHFNENERVISTNLNFNKNERVKVFWDNYTVPKHFYNYVMLLCLAKHSARHQGMGLIGLVCKLNDVDIKCKTQVIFQTNRTKGPYFTCKNGPLSHQNPKLTTDIESKDYFYFGNDLVTRSRTYRNGIENRRRIYDRDSGSYSEQFKTFVKNFIEIVRQTECAYTSIDFVVQYGDQAHQNILLAFKSVSTDKIIIMIYDPHGAHAATKIVGLLSTSFMMRMMDVEPDVFLIDRRDKLSCHYGLQAITDDRIGLCMSFSLLWLYILMQVSKNTNNGVTPNNIAMIEHIIIRDYSPARVIEITDSFIMLLINAFSAETGLQLNDKYFLKDFRLEMTATHYKSSYIYYRKHIQAEEKEISDRDDIQVSDEPIPKIIDKEQCTFHSECLSNLCINNECFSADDYYNDEEKYNAITNKINKTKVVLAEDLPNILDHKKIVKYYNRFHLQKMFKVEK
jgi:hypothetical protein